MEFNLIWDETEWTQPELAFFLQLQGGMATETLGKNNTARPKIYLTCSDEGIAWAGAQKLPVLAVRSGDYEARNGRQSLFGVPVMAEEVADIDQEILELAYCRCRNLPLKISQTSRCVIRELGEADIPELFRLTGGWINEGSLKPQQLDAAEYEAFWKAYIQNMYRIYGYGLWLVECQGQILGMAGYESPEYEFEIGSGRHVVELAYWIRPEYRGQGFAREVCSYLTQHVHTWTGAEEIQIWILGTNQPSIGVARSLGARKTQDFMWNGSQILCYTIT